MLYRCPHCTSVVFLPAGELSNAGELCPKRGCGGILDQVFAPELEGWKAFTQSLETFAESLKAIEPRALQ